jgi:tRNA-Thr(GGU) m(6)t(6)A37 methyltransferase TsaA
MEPSLIVRPIGFIRNAARVKFDTRHQPLEGAGGSHVLELQPGHRESVRDLGGFTRIWLVWWFHRNTTWRPLVLPPRGPSRRRGVFATRSPHRPNPIGLTPVTLLRVDKDRLWLGACDLMDGTPVLDIKPYIPAYDSFPEESAGWMSEVEALAAVPPPHTVRFEAKAMEQVDWLASGWGIDFRPRLIELLERDPKPHRTRRIQARGEGCWTVGCGPWRAVFRLQGVEVWVTGIEAGFPRRFLADRGRKDVPDREAQRAFLERWPGSGVEGDDWQPG